MQDLVAPHLLELAKSISIYPELAELLARAIIDNPPAVIRDGGVLKTGYDAELDELQSLRSEEHTSELQSLMRISYAVFCLKKKTPTPITIMHKSLPLLALQSHLKAHQLRHYR